MRICCKSDTTELFQPSILFDSVWDLCVCVCELYLYERYTCVAYMYGTYAVYISYWLGVGSVHVLLVRVSFDIFMRGACMLHICVSRSSSVCMYGVHICAYIHT
jgi:hypothetical protein